MQARLPSCGQFLCYLSQTEAVSVVSNMLQMNHVNKCHAAAGFQQPGRCNASQWLHIADFAAQNVSDVQELLSDFTNSCVLFVHFSM